MQMAAKAFSGVRSVFFDAYGTLFNVHAPVARVAGRIGEKADLLSRLWRQKQLEYTWLRSLMGTHADFWQVTGDALDYALEAHGIADQTLREELMQLYLGLDAYDDARVALAGLKQAGLETGILSNGSPRMLAAAVRSAGLGASLDHVLSVEAVGIYKPKPSVYQMALDAARATEPDELGFVSANTWDAQAAANFGFTVARIDRFGLKDERLPGRPAVTITSLAALLELI
jgi:2-haloacid dehalogenase